MQISSDAEQIAITNARNRNSASGTLGALFRLAMHRPGINETVFMSVTRSELEWRFGVRVSGELIKIAKKEEKGGGKL